MEVNTKKAVWLLAVPAFLTGILAYLENNFFAIFLTNVAMLSNEAYTKVTVTGASIIAFSSLVSGILVQKVNFKKGKNRPWLIPMAIAIVIGRYMQFTPIKAAESTLVLWFMYFCALCSLVFVIIKLPDFFSFKFYPGYAGLTFPMAIGIVATQKMAGYLTEAGSALAYPLSQLAGLQIFLTSGLVFYVLVMLSRMLLMKEYVN